MLSYEEKKAIERIEDFLTTNIIVSISNNETANSEELKVFISKNEYLAIEFIASMFLKQSKEIEELKKYEKYYEEMEEVNKKFIAVDKIKAKIEELKEDIKYSANPLSIDNSKFGIKVLQSLLEKE